MIHADGASPEDAQAYVERWRLATPEQAAHAVRFATDPTWRAYVITYTAGRDLCRAYTAGDPARFRTLLTEHVRIGDLRAGRSLSVAVAAEREYGLHIGGEAVEPASGELRELREPATGELLARAAMAGEADVDRAVAAARAAVEGAWGKTPATERSRLLHALADAIAANRKELAELESRNVGKAISSVKAELAGATENFRYFASATASIAGRSNPIGGSLLFYSQKEPVGVAAQIVPWNYPLLMATWKLAPALAAGCSVVLKPDPLTPLSVLRVAELAAEVGFPAGVDQHRPRRRADDRRVPRPPPRRRQGRVHRLDEDGRRDHAAVLRPDQARHARARRQEPEPRLRRRRPRPTRFRRASGRSSRRPASRARRARGCSSSSRSTTTSSRR